MNKIKNILAILLIALLSIASFSSCSQTPENGNASDATTNNTSPRLISVANKSVTGLQIDLSVEKAQNTLELFNLVKVSNGAVWKVYDVNSNSIANKVVSLNDGHNTFYIEVALPDGSYATTYTLNVFKSYDITVKYVHKYGVREHTLKEITIEQGKLFNADYVPVIYGYDFISWIYGYNNDFKEGYFTVSVKLIANAVPKPAKLHFIIDDEEWQVVDSAFDQTIVFPIPEDKENYYFWGKNDYDKNWTYESGSFTESLGDYRCNTWGDIYLYGKYVPKTYTITYDYGEMLRNDKQVQSVRYGEHFVVIKPSHSYAYGTNGVKYVFSGFEYNGEPFESGKYFYDGNITVTAVWLPAES